MPNQTSATRRTPVGDAGGPTKRRCIIAVAAALAIVAALGMRKSGDAAILGRWSLPYFAVMCATGTGTLLIGLLLARFGRRAAFAMAPIAVVGLLAGLCTEMGGQLYARSRPAHDALFLQPHPVLGWLHVPKMELTWSGHGWYAIDFSVPMRFNSAGFRDREWVEAKPPGVKRIAILGDSMVEAMQVPWEFSAAQILERALNEGVAGSQPAQPSATMARSGMHEVLNFGVSNFGTGQCLLAWEQYARKYDPDYVFIFVAGFHMVRTVTAFESGAFPGREQERLWIRPTFSIERGALLRHPARDFDRFVELQKELIQGPFHGKRIKPRARRSFVVSRVLNPIVDGLGRWMVQSDRASSDASVPQETALVCDRVLEALGQSTREAHARLIVVDACRYFERSDGALSLHISTMCRQNGFGYVDLSTDLIEAKEAGISVRWPSDMHFNEAGNRIFAEAMLNWLVEVDTAETGGVSP